MPWCVELEGLGGYMAGRVRMILPRPDLCHLISENTPELWTLPAAFVCHGGSLEKIQIDISLIFSVALLAAMCLLDMGHPQLG